MAEMEPTTTTDDALSREDRMKLGNLVDSSAVSQHIAHVCVEHDPLSSSDTTNLAISKGASIFKSVTPADGATLFAHPNALTELNRSTTDRAFNTIEGAEIGHAEHDMWVFVPFHTEFPQEEKVQVTIRRDGQQLPADGHDWWEAGSMTMSADVMSLMHRCRNAVISRGTTNGRVSSKIDLPLEHHPLKDVMVTVDYPAQYLLSQDGLRDTDTCFNLRFYPLVSSAPDGTVTRGSFHDSCFDVGASDSDSIWGKKMTKGTMVWNMRRDLPSSPSKVEQSEVASQQADTGQSSASV
ncbi:hypothetical protein IAT38_007741 [Cryptococcus sp. DSM 104549]